MRVDYRAYWENLKDKVIEYLSSENTEIQEMGKQIKYLITEIEKEQRKDYEF